MSGNLPDRQHAVNFGALVVLVFRLNGMLTAAGDALAAPAGQTSARWRVLAAVEETPMTVAQIARAWSLARQSVQRVSDVLERDGLIAYEPNPAHRRASLLRLTPDGETALRRIQEAQQTWAAAVGERIGTDDLGRTTWLLERVIAALE